MGLLFGTKMNKSKKLDLLKGEAEFCNSCSLCGIKVWDNGNPDADLVIIAEAPGADEEANGVPLIGRSGKLVEDMLNHIGLSRKDTWRMNCLVCRPPNNRDPLPEEIKSCEYFLYKQIEIIEPKVIVCLGKFAAQKMLGSEDPIGKMVNNWYESEDGSIEMFVMYHPSYILRNGNELIPAYKKSWEQIKEKL